MSVETELFRLLKYNENLLYAAKNEYDCCDILVTRLLPLMRIMFSDLYDQWQKEREVRIKKRLELEDKALSESRQYFELLKQRVNGVGLLEEIHIKQNICIIETMLNVGSNNRDSFVRVSIVPEKAPMITVKKTKYGTKKVFLTNYKKDFEVRCLNCGGLEEHHRSYVFPSYVWGVNNAVKDLCVAIVSLGREDLVADGVEIQYVSETKFVEQKEGNILQPYRCECGYVYEDQTALTDIAGKFISFDQLSHDWFCLICNSKKDAFRPYLYPMVCSVPHVNSFTFASSFCELQELNNHLAKESLYRKDTDEVWIAIEALYRIEWAWNKSHDDLRKQNERLKKKNCVYNSPQDYIKRASLLVLNNLTAEVNQLKPKRKSYNRVFFCDRDNINKNVQIVLNSMYGRNDASQFIADLPFPYSIELQMKEDLYLFLKVEWIPGLIQVFHLHSFQYLPPSSYANLAYENTNIRCNFMNDLLDNPSKLIEMDPNDAYINAAQYLEKVGVCGIIYKLFIEKRTRYGAALKSNKIPLTGRPPAVLKKVRNYIETLNPVQCYNCEQFYCATPGKCS